MAMRSQIRLFGGFEVLVRGARVADSAWNRRHAAAVVKLLALSPGRRLHRDRVLDALWPDLLVEEAAPRLHKATHYARAAMGDRESVVLTGETVALLPGEDVSVDVEEFDALAEAARAGAGDSIAAQRAVEIYRGDLLPDDIYEPWTEQPREIRRMRYLDLLRGLGLWERLVELDPADEEAHLHLAQQHLDRGDGKAAVRQIAALEEALERDLGVALGAEAREMRERARSMPVPVSEAIRLERLSRVPAPATPTVGRASDIAVVRRMLVDSPIVTLLGPGGVGKTRLAVEVALQWTESVFPQVCFVDLTKVDASVLVPELVARELGLRLDAAGAGERVLEEALRGQTMLLVLDNFEHVLDAASLAPRLAGCSADIRLLCTSRARLHVTGERLFDVAPLDAGPVTARQEAASLLPDAVRLFEQAATGADPGFRLAPHLTDVAAICRTVDGLPLAIELAAGYVRTLPPSLLRARLRARLASPVGAARDVPRRHRTIPETIDWSLQLLGDRERAVFARLGVFAGPVGLDVVERVCADPATDDADVLDALTRLVDHSLVRRILTAEGEPRFFLLELLRQRARELLAEGEGEAVAARHADHVACFLDELEEQRWDKAANRWIDLISDMLGEIRTAHAWAVERGRVRVAQRITAGMGAYWHREGHLHEGREWVSHALSEPPEDSLLLGRLRLSAGFVTWPLDQRAARQHWSSAAGLFRSIHHDRYLAYSLALTSLTHLGEESSYQEALLLCDEAVELSRRVAEAPLIAQALNIKGELLRVLGAEHTQAQKAYEEGLDVARAVGDEALVSVFLANLAFLADHRGNYLEARHLGLEALRICWRLGRRMMAAWTVFELAARELGLGRAERGAVLVGAADQALLILDASRHPGDFREHERVLSGLLVALGQEQLDRLLEEGSRLSLDDAVLLALGDPGDDDR